MPHHHPRRAEPAPAKAGVVLKLKTAWRDGTSHHLMTPMELTQLLAALVPRPRLHLPFSWGADTECEAAQGGGAGAD